MYLFYQQVKSLLKISEIRKKPTTVLELKNPSSPIFPKIGGTKEKIKEKKRQIKKRIK